MNFNLSEQESKKLNHEFSAAVDSLLSAADRLEAFESLLQNEFAAISHEHKLQIEAGTTRLASSFWRICLQKHRVLDEGRTLKLPEREVS
ncbi:MAG: hypothetical protein ACO24H_03565 [Polynucleobacter sp.]